MNIYYIECAKALEWPNEYVVIAEDEYQSKAKIDELGIDYVEAKIKLLGQASEDEAETRIVLSYKRNDDD